MKDSEVDIISVKCSCGKTTTINRKLGRASIENQSQWQPIETAPKDGTEIIVVWYSDFYVGAPPKSHVGICSWAGAWVPYNREPTYWRPVPAAPQSPAPKEGDT